jgi:hypothetical protein
MLVMNNCTFACLFMLICRVQFCVGMPSNVCVPYSLGIGIKHYSNTVLLTALHVVVCLRHMLLLDCFYLFTRYCVIM